MNKFLKKKYRLIYDSKKQYATYIIQVKVWWLPIWISSDEYSFKFKESAELEYTRLINERDNAIKIEILQTE